MYINAYTIHTKKKPKTQNNKPTNSNRNKNRTSKQPHKKKHTNLIQPNNRFNKELLRLHILESVQLLFKQ